MPAVLLAAGLSGPTRLESVCLAVTTEGALPPAEEVAARLSDVLGLLGINVVSEGCQATLRLSLVGSRSSALYAAVGRCWSGWTVTGATSVRFGGEGGRAWPVDVAMPVAAVVFECESATDPIPEWKWAGPAVEVPFTEMFGRLGGLAAFSVFGSPYGFGPFVVDRLAPPTAEEVQALTSWLFHDPGLLSGGAGIILTDWAYEHPESMLPMTPYLIALAGSCEAAQDISKCLEAWEAGHALEVITGHETAHLWSQADWWAWWQEHQG